MRTVKVSQNVEEEILNLRTFLIEEWNLSEEAAYKRVARMNSFLKSLGGIVDYPLCRFKNWRELGYRCVPFEKNWIFAYEIYDNGIIIQDMSHTAILVE